MEHSIILTASLCLVAFGAVMVYSASSAVSLYGETGDSAAFLKRYLVFAAVGLAAMHIMTRVRLDTVRRLALPLLIVTVLMLVAVAVAGHAANGAQRWLGVGWFRLQPSEMAKLALILFTAAYVAKRPERVLAIRGLLRPLSLVAAAFIVLAFLQRDLGTALVAALAVGAMLVASGAKARHLVALGAAVGLLALLFILVEPFRMGRVTSFLDPSADPAGGGYQARQAMMALGSGGPVGLGLGESVQKIFYLPEEHTDMILAVIGEELGLLGVSILLALYGLIGYAGLRTAQLAGDWFARLVAVGVTALVAVQAVLNFAAVMGLAPITGIPLPLVSYGGTSLIVLLAGIGLLLNVSAGAHAAAGADGRERRAGESSGKRSGREGNAGRDRDRWHGRPRRAGARDRRRFAR